MKNSLCKSIVFSAAMVLFAAGCKVHVTTPPAEVEVASAPPPAQVDVVTPSPGPDYVWIGGDWEWGPGGWVWDRGHWDHPPRVGAVWVPHRFEDRGGRHVFVRGGWR